MISAKKNAVWSVRWSLHCFELQASPWFSFANSDRSGNPICSDVSQIQLEVDLSVIYCHDFSYLLHEHCRVTSLRIIQFPCISWICISENYALRFFTFGQLSSASTHPENYPVQAQYYNAQRTGRGHIGIIILLDSRGKELECWVWHGRPRRSLAKII